MGNETCSQHVKFPGDTVDGRNPAPPNMHETL